jgi:hypothetical protein
MISFLHLGCSFVDPEHAHVPIQPLDDVPTLDPAAAKHLQRPVYYTLRGFGCCHLRHGRLERDVVAGVAAPRRVIRKERRRLQICGHFGKRCLRQLKIGERLAEHAARANVTQRLLESTPGEAERGGGD